MGIKSFIFGILVATIILTTPVGDDFKDPETFRTISEIIMDKVVPFVMNIIMDVIESSV